jgi:hypothetical protein
MSFGPIATLLQIAPIAPRDWAIAGLLAILPVLWRVVGTDIGLATMPKRIIKTAVSGLLAWRQCRSGPA